MKQLYPTVFATAFLCMLTSCDKESSEKEIIPPLTTAYLAGKTYDMAYTTSLRITFFSEDSVYFSCKGDVIDPTVQGRAAYTVSNDTVEILNPYNRRLQPEEVNAPYFLSFKAGLDERGYLEGFFFYVGLQERLQYSGSLSMVMVSGEALEERR